jgi:hypothetical protein
MIRNKNLLSLILLFLTAFVHLLFQPEYPVVHMDDMTSFFATFFFFTPLLILITMNMFKKRDGLLIEIGFYSIFVSCILWIIGLLQLLSILNFDRNFTNSGEGSILLYILITSLGTAFISYFISLSADFNKGSIK